MNGHGEATVFAQTESLETGEPWPVREDMFSAATESGFESGFESGGFETPYESGFESGYESAGLESGYETAGLESAFESPYESPFESAGFESAGLESAFESPYESGYESGFESGLESYETAGLESGFESPFESTGLESPYESGYESGFESGLESYETAGLESGFESGFESPFESGFESAGLESAFESPYESTALESPYESAYESGLESAGLESAYETGFESGYATETPYESGVLEDSPYESSTYEDMGFEDTAYESAYEDMGFEDAAVGFETSGLEHGWESPESAFETPALEDAWEHGPAGESLGAAECASCGQTQQEQAYHEERHRPVPPHVRTFVRTYRRAALASQAATSVPALVTLGQAALESNWGRRAPGFNFFGIKARASDPPQARQLLTTREVLSRPGVKFPQVISVTPRPDGRYTYVVRAWFRRYPSVAVGFAAHGRLLRRNRRYAPAFAYTADPYAFARAVAAAGYATDPRYASALTDVMRLIARASRPRGRVPASRPPLRRPLPARLPRRSPAPAPVSPGIPSAAPMPGASRQPSPGPASMPAAPAGLAVPPESVPIPSLPVPPAPCTAGADPPANRALRAPVPGPGRFEGNPAVAAFAASLAGVYGQRAGRDPASRAQKAREREEWLAGDYTKTMQAGVARFGGGWRQRMNRQVAARVGQLRTARRGTLTADDMRELEAERCRQEAWWLTQLNGLRRGWMVGRREQVDFSTLMPPLPMLPGFNPPPLQAGAAPALEPMAPYGSGPPVAAATRRFLAELRGTAGSSFSAGNYAGHGGGTFRGRGYSVDLFLNTQLDVRGFYPRAAAVTFLGQVAAAASAAGLRWRVLYNDFAVAAAVNRRTGARNVVFMGDSSSGLNWHGPLVLHFHLDLAP